MKNRHHGAEPIYACKNIRLTPFFSSLLMRINFLAVCLSTSTLCLRSLLTLVCCSTLDVIHPFVDLTETPTYPCVSGSVYWNWQAIAQGVQVTLTHGLSAVCISAQYQRMSVSVILAHRLYAMYERHRKVLIFLVSISHSPST